MKNILFGLALIAVPLYVSATEEWAGPFGLEMGMSEEQLKAKAPDLKKISDFHFSFERAPNHFAGTDLYIAQVGKTSGLCRVTALSSVESSRFGDAVKTKFDNIQSALSDKYGAPSNAFDFLQRGSLWTKPEDWMMGLAQGDRTLASFWVSGNEGGENQLPANLGVISLTADGRSSSLATIALKYELSNIDECIDEAKQKDASAL